jgi:hypothetical protein
MFNRWYAHELKAKLNRPYVHLLFGARHTGKSTLLNELLPVGTLRFNLADPLERSRHLANPGEFAQACRSLPARKNGQFVFVDEAQTVPSIFDAVQALYDADKTRWRFVLCGSSARKLRQTGQPAARTQPGAPASSADASGGQVDGQADAERCPAPAAVSGGKETGVIAWLPHLPLPAPVTIARPSDGAAVVCALNGSRFSLRVSGGESFWCRGLVMGNGLDRLPGKT